MNNKSIKQEHYHYYAVLEAIRQSGDTNMWGAAPYLVRLCPELHYEEAVDILLEWIENYNTLVSSGIIKRN